MKTCRKCGRSKELSEFYKDKTAGDGLHFMCKACDKEREKKRVRVRDPQYMKQWWRDHPDYLRDWKERNKKQYDNGQITLPDQKRCSCCHKTKPSDQFHMNRSSKDGLAYECADCVSARTAGRSIWKKI